MLRIATALVPTVVASVFGAACSDDGDESVLVLAASSLTDALATIETAFEAAHPGIDVELSFGGSTTLTVQLDEGAPADVIALADTLPMAALSDAGLVDEPALFATNTMVLATPTDNPGRVDGIDDLSDPALLVGVCAPQVPCGRYARQVFDQAGVEIAADTEEPNVRALAAKIASAELDAGLVYATDVRALSDRLATVALPDGIDVRAEYPIAVVADTSHRDAAQRFVDFVASPAAQAILADSGFGGG